MGKLTRRNLSFSERPIFLLIATAIISSLTTLFLTGRTPTKIYEKVEFLLTSSPQHDLKREHQVEFTYTPKSEQWWDELVPSEGGILDTKSQFFKENGKHLDLLPGTEQVGISMFHQLHCLQMIRNEMTREPVVPLRGKRGSAMHHHHAADSGSGMGKHGDDGKSSMKSFDGHLFHCLDYIAQSVLCCADRSLEAPVDEDGSIDGGGTVHTCRNSDVLYDVVI